MSNSNFIRAKSLGRNVPFDQSFPAEEQLPRRFRVDFMETDQYGETVVIVQKDGAQIGDPLTDNSFDDDGYRYHDVFHFANAAILGWSPMTRKLLGCKRRSNPQISVVEDGGRAKVLEEVVCALIYDYGLLHGFDVSASEVDDEFVNTLRRLTADREVSCLDVSIWRRLVEISLTTWKAMWENQGGALEGDLLERRLQFVPRAIEMARD